MSAASRFRVERSWGPNENGRFTRAELEALPGFRTTHSGRRSRSACPIHGGDNPEAFEVDFDTGRGHCFTNGCWGYLVDGDAGQPSRRREKSTRGDLTPAIPAPASPPAPPDPERVATLPRAWRTLTEALPGSPAEAYLASRGIPLAVAQAARVGYDAGGVLGPKMRGRVVFPLATIEGELVNAIGRVIADDDPRRRWESLPGQKGYFNPAAVRQARESAGTLYLTEGPFDALALLAGGISTAAAICGADGVVKREHLRGVGRVVMCFDADATGQANGPKLGRLAAGVGCDVLRLTADELVGCKDVSEYWQTNGALPPGLVELPPFLRVQPPELPAPPIAQNCTVSTPLGAEDLAAHVTRLEADLEEGWQRVAAAKDAGDEQAGRSEDLWTRLLREYEQAADLLTALRS